MTKDEIITLRVSNQTYLTGLKALGFKLIRDYEEMKGGITELIKKLQAEPMEQIAREEIAICEDLQMKIYAFSMYNLQFN